MLKNSVEDFHRIHIVPLDPAYNALGGTEHLPVKKLKNFLYLP